MSELIRINRIFSYKVVKEVVASEFAAFFELNQENLNDYFVLSSQAQFSEPRLIRDSLFFLKHEIAKSPILILNLQSVENKLISNKQKPPTNVVIELNE